MDQNEFVPLSCPIDYKGTVFWIDDSFLRINGHGPTLDKEDILSCIEKVSIDTELEKPELFNISGCFIYRTITIGRHCLNKSLRLYIGHFAALENLSDDELFYFREKPCLFLMDCENEDTNPTGQTQYGLELVNKKQIPLSQVRFFSRYTGEPEIFETANRLWGLDKSEFYAYGFICTGTDIHNAQEHIDSFFSDPITWFLNSPRNQIWFGPGVAHNQGSDPFANLHHQSVSMRFPLHPLTFEAAKSLIGCPFTKGSAVCSPEAVRTVLGEKLIIDENMINKGFFLPCKPGLLFIWACKLTFDEVLNDYDKHGNGFTKPTGEMKLWNESNNEIHKFILAIKYNGAKSVGSGVTNNFASGAYSSHSVSCAAYKALRGKIDVGTNKLTCGAPDAVVNALPGCDKPIAELYADDEWFGFSWKE